MMTLVAGADRDGMRFVLFGDDSQITERTLTIAALKRNERQLVDIFLGDSGYTWKDVDRYISLRVPHSHTSVRVVATILKTSAWYYGVVYAQLATNALDEFDGVALIGRCKEAQNGTFFS